MQKMEGDNIYLYKVLDQECISRETAKELWKSGKVTGLFNLPSEELFAACKDFGIKVEPSECTSMVCLFHILDGLLLINENCFT